MASDDILGYPVAIFQDRFGGLATGGKWVAVAKANAAYDINHTRFGAVFDCAHDRENHYDFPNRFGEEPWVAAGATPDEALENLRSRLRQSGEG